MRVVLDRTTPRSGAALKASAQRSLRRIARLLAREMQ